jgi:hypothetical protein
MTTTHKIWLLIGLLILSVGFWLWSEDYYLNKTMFQKEMKQQVVEIGTPISDTELDMQIDTALLLDSEIELKAIDSEF